jgi:hypothetical protein
MSNAPRVLGAAGLPSFAMAGGRPEGAAQLANFPQIQTNLWRFGINSSATISCNPFAYIFKQTVVYLLCRMNKI